jgi:type I restriction enzyme, S subunit
MELLQKHFDTALESPNGIKKLRELILTLAMQGKLVPQDPNDQPASELLKEIQLEKERLIKEGKIRKQKPLQPIKAEEIPYDVPSGWLWVRLGELFKVTSGTNLTKEKMIEGSIPVYGGNGVAGYHNEYNIEKSTIVIGRVGFYCGSIHLTPEKAWITDNAFITYYDEQRLFQFYVIWLLKIINLQIDTSATAQPVISGSKIYPILIPLPPLAEQKRIVAKIDELMTLCDKLEKQRQDRDKKRLKVHESAINSLLTASDKKSFDSSWQFIVSNFDSLYSVKENVAGLKKAILTLAMQGKLVPQDPNDQPASVLLKEIQAEKARLIKEGKIRKQKPLQPIKAEEIPYDVPEGWEWTRLSNVLDVRDGTHDTPKYIDQGVPLITSKNLYTGILKFDNVKFIAHEDYCRIKERSNVENGDILFAMIGSIGNPVIVDTIVEFSIKNVALFKFYKKYKPLNRYIYMFLLMAQKNIKDISSGAVQSFVSLGFLRNYLLPLPPLAEQKRIVAKIDELMALCDKLEENILKATKKQTELFDSVLAKV